MAICKGDRDPVPPGAVRFRPVPAITFIRHGESEFNRHWAATGTDPLIRDAPLSDFGHEQVRAARPAARALEPDLVISSPLTRALQTAVGLFGDDGTIPIVVDAGHRERVTGMDDIGSSPEDLAARFPRLSFAHLTPTWWHQGPVDELGVPVEPEDVFHRRVASFLRSLDALPPGRIVVVGHRNFFARILGRHLDNCEIAPYAPSPPG